MSQVFFTFLLFISHCSWFVFLGYAPSLCGSWSLDAFYEILLYKGKGNDSVNKQVLSAPVTICKLKMAKTNLHILHYLIQKSLHILLFVAAVDINKEDLAHLKCEWN